MQTDSIQPFNKSMFVAILWIVLALAWLTGCSSGSQPETNPEVISLPTIFPTETLTPSITHAPTITLTLTTGLGLTSRSVLDGAVMVIYVPAGEFVMGSDPGTDPYFWGAESPSHAVYVDAFWLYQTEVTNAMYQMCVEQKACPRPDANRSSTHKNYYGNPDYDNYPVILVSWVHAVSYCKWAGGRLPTEAEWEKAARGEDGRLFPWGNSPLRGDLANFCDHDCPGNERESGLDDGYRDTAPVGSYPAGVSPYGALDMAGNVWEWVFDYFVPEYYKVSPLENPLGPAFGTRRVIRGGSWYNPASGIRTVARASLTPDNALGTVVFRCAMDVP